jgi:hypothetical protein
VGIEEASGWGGVDEVCRKKAKFALRGWEVGGKRRKASKKRGLVAFKG